MLTQRPRLPKRAVPMTLVMVLAGFLTVVGRLDAQEPKMLFKMVDMSTMELNEKQAKILDRVKKAPTTIDVRVLKLEEEALKEAGGTLSIPLGEGKTLEMKNYKLTRNDGVEHLNWKGATPSHLVAFTIRGQSVTGLICKGKRVYSVEPLGNGLQVLVQVDQSKFPMDR